MAKFRKKPVIIEAFRFGIDRLWPDWFSDMLIANEVITFRGNNGICCEIKTLEGVMRGTFGDYIIQGVNGEVYACKPDIFAKTYDQIDERGAA